MGRKRTRRAAGLLICLLAVAVVSPAKDKRLRELAERYREFLEHVDLLISQEEREAFLALAEDYQRDAFMRRFWEARDPRPDAPGNEFKETYEARREHAFEEFGGPRDDRFRVFVLNGPPGELFETDCGVLLWPLQFWKYGYSPHTRGSLTVIFYQPNGGGPFRLWRPSEGYAVLGPTLGSEVSLDEQRRRFHDVVRQYCGEYWADIERMLLDFRAYENDGPGGPVRAERRPQIADPEWLATFRAFSTEVDAGAPELEAELEVAFAGVHQSRVVVEGRIAVAPGSAASAALAGHRSYDFEVTGEVLRGDELFESFKYRFQLPERGSGESLPLVFERYLRPGSYRWLVKLADLHGGGRWRRELEVEVPAPAAAPRQDSGAEPAAPPPPAPALELRAEPTELHTGMSRFVAVPAGEGVAKVTFFLEGRPVLTKSRPPFSVELALGSIPRSRKVRAVAYDETGAEVATDEVVLNPGQHAFTVNIVEPRQGGSYDGQMRVQVEVDAPEGELVERLELYLDEAPVATLFQPPFVQRLTVESGELGFLRAVAFLADGSSTEDTAIFNAPGVLEAVDVRLVELYATVLDREGHPIAGLEAPAFRVLENGVEQELLRFDRLDDLPLHLELLLDVSASMESRLDRVRAAALEFFEQALEPQDRAAVITFSRRPRLAAAFTNDVSVLASSLASLRAESTTALYDSLRYGLYYFQGIRGQRAVLVLSDGEDRRSETSFEEVLDYARATGVTVYAIGIAPKKSRGGFARLARLARETGGRSFEIRDVDELGGVYDTIQRDLRSRYLLVYQPSAAGDGAFRAVAVEVGVPGAEVRALAGYYP